MKCAVVALLLAAGVVPAAAGDQAATLAPAVRRLLAVPEPEVPDALAAVRAKGRAVVEDLRRVRGRNATAQERVDRALTLIAQDWHRTQVPEGMVYVPAGAVEVPRTPSRLGDHGPSGKRAAVAAFYIDRTEVSVQMWRAWCKALDEAGEPAASAWRGGALDPELNPRLPVRGISQRAAARYAREHRSGRLPTATEFERAMRGSGLRPYPWGAQMEAGRANMDWGKAHGRPLPVGSFPAGASPFDVLDLAGNVAEWTSTFVSFGRAGKRPLVLGGSYRDVPTPALMWRAGATPRLVQSDRSRAAWIGFRVARSAPPLP